MRVTIIYTTQLRAALGLASESVELPTGASIAVLLDFLAGRHGEAFRTLVLGSDGQILPSILLAVNDQQILDPANQPLASGDEVMILSAISGG